VELWLRGQAEQVGGPDTTVVLDAEVETVDGLRRITVPTESVRWLDKLSIAADRFVSRTGLRWAGSVRSVLLDVRASVTLGVPERRAAVAVPTPKPAPGTAFPPRRLVLRGVPVFELNLWCGTCPAMFRKLAAVQHADLDVVNDILNAGMDRIADAVTCFSSNVAVSAFDQSTPGGSGRWLCI
jgi:hypothetical protein